LAGDYDEWDIFGTFYHYTKLEMILLYEQFYGFLRYAHAQSSILVIKGNHEVIDNSKLYVSKRINSISNCIEISGKHAMVKGLCFVGIGYDEAASKKTLTPLLKGFSRLKVDFVVTHCLLGYLPHMAKLVPKAIIWGHAASGPGKFLVNDVPVISSGVVKYSIIESHKEAISITQSNNGDSRKEDDLWFSKHKFRWLKPWYK